MVSSDLQQRCLALQEGSHSGSPDPSAPQSACEACYCTTLMQSMLLHISDALNALSLLRSPARWAAWEPHAKKGGRGGSFFSHMLVLSLA